MLKHIDVKLLESWIIEKRREFHRIPELSFHEFRTKEKIFESLNELGIEGKTIANTGIVATIDGKGPGRCIAIRAEMDGLEMTEDITNLNREYISRHPGFMHSCGHDGHMAMVLGAAKVLMGCRNTFSGSIRLIFQPGEELPPGGAIQVIGSGGLEGVDAIIGMHIFSIIDSGRIIVKSGPLLASSTSINLKIKGKGGHYVRPELCIDPIMIASIFISSIQKEIRKKIPENRFILGFGKIAGGLQANWIPDTVEMLGSFRTFDQNDQVLIKEIIRRTLDELMHKFSKHDICGLPLYELDILHGYPVLINDPEFSKQVYDILKIRYPNLTDHTEPHFGSEDFAHFAQKVPGVFMILGTKNIRKGIINGNHSCRFDIDEDILLKGALIFSTIALDFLKDPHG